MESWQLDGAPGRKKKIKELDKVLEKLHEEQITLFAAGRPTEVIDQRKKELHEELDVLFEAQELYAPCRNGVLIRVLENLIEIKKLLETPRASDAIMMRMESELARKTSRSGIQRTV